MKPNWVRPVRLLTSTVLTTPRTDESDFDRTVALGYLVESLEGLCGPHLWVLNEISSALYEMHAANGEHGEEKPHHHTH
jgi:hypothetical protein